MSNTATQGCRTTDVPSREIKNGQYSLTPSNMHSSKNKVITVDSSFALNPLDYTLNRTVLVFGDMDSV